MGARDTCQEAVAMIQERDEHGLDQGGVEVKVLVRNGWVLSVCVFVCVFVCVCVCVCVVHICSTFWV